MIIRIAFILALLWASPGLALDITFLQSSSVINDTVLLSDIANTSEQTPLSRALGSQIVGASPEPGTVTVLDAREIILKIEKSHNSRLKDVIWKGSPLITVTRKSVTITSEMIQEMIDDYIAENVKRLPDAEITFIPESLPLPFEIQYDPSLIDERFSYSVSARIEDGNGTPLWISSFSGMCSDCGRLSTSRSWVSRTSMKTVSAASSMLAASSGDSCGTSESAGAPAPQNAS